MFRFEEMVPAEVAIAPSSLALSLHSPNRKTDQRLSVVVHHLYRSRTIDESTVRLDVRADSEADYDAFLIGQYSRHCTLSSVGFVFCPLLHDAYWSFAPSSYTTSAVDSLLSRPLIAFSAQMLSEYVTTS